MTVKKNLLVTIGITVLSLSFIVGCSTFETNTYKASAVATATVDRAMKSWTSYVVWSRSQPSISQTEVAVQESRVKLAYSQYQLAQQAVYEARKEYKASADLGKSTLENALAALSGAADSLVKIVEFYLPPPAAAAASTTKK